MSVFLAPSVTPWETTLPDVMGGLGNNPGIRLIQYDRDSGAVLDIHQYYLNLTEANLQSAARWQLEYRATSYFAVPDMTPSSLHEFAERMKDDDEAFGKYYRANGVLYDPEERWMEETRTIHYCAMVNMDYKAYDSCVKSREETVSIAPSSKTRGFVLILLTCRMLLSSVLDYR